MIIFVGDKASSKNIDPNVPFVGTQSYAILMSWIGQLQIHWKNFHITNKDKATYMYHYYSDTAKYIALGNEAEKELKRLKIKYFKLPHPSGLNRKLNDKDYIKKKLKECKEFIDE